MSKRRDELLKLTWGELISLAQRMNVVVCADDTKRHIATVIIKAEQVNK